VARRGRGGERGAIVLLLAELHFTSQQTQQGRSQKELYKKKKEGKREGRRAARPRSDVLGKGAKLWTLWKRPGRLKKAISSEKEKS